MALSMFKRKSKSSTAAAAAAAADTKDKTFNVQYLGSLRTFKGKGSDCLDEPLREIWEKSNRGTRSAKAQLTIAADGVNLERMDIKELPTSVQFFQLHRISYCGIHSKYPRVVTWIHRNELQRMQVEMRAHAVICNRAEKARQIADMLNQRLRTAFTEYKREMQVKDKISAERRSSEGMLDMASLKALGSQRSTFMPPVAKRGSVPALGIILEKGKLVGVSEMTEEDEDEEEEEGGIL